MSERIKDYLFIVLIKIIIGYMFFMFFLLVIFIGYIVIADWGSAVNFMIELINEDLMKVVAPIPLIFSWFGFKPETPEEREFREEETRRFMERMDFWTWYDTMHGNY